MTSERPKRRGISGLAANDYIGLREAIAHNECWDAWEAWLANRGIPIKDELTIKPKKPSQRMMEMISASGLLTFPADNSTMIAVIMRFLDEEYERRSDGKD